MLVNEESFTHLTRGSRLMRLLGMEALIPSPEHLVALKLHALRHGGEDRFEKDFGDVVGITRNQKLAATSPEFRDMFLKYGTADLYERLLRRLG